jgi:hypothetical protein
MIRKTILALTATAAIGAAALAPTAASAWHFGHYGHFGHFGFYRGFGPIVVGPSCIRWVETRFGLRRVNVCELDY